MNRLIPFALMAMTGTAHASALGTPTPSTGLGTGGVALLGPHAMTIASPTANVYLETGDNPSPVMTFTIPVPVNAPGKRPACLAQIGWTMPEYADGLAIPEWPLVQVDRSSYTPNSPTDTTPPSVTFRIRALDALNGFQDNSNYQVTVICGPRQS